MTLVIDLSHHNVIPSSLQPAWDSGVRGLIHKVTEGTSFTDSKVKARYAMVYGTPMLWGVYHFMRPGKIEEQAMFFLKQSYSISTKNTLFACDHEDAGVSLQDVFTFMQIVEKETKAAPILYSGHVLKEQMEKNFYEPLTQYRLWLAQYGTEKPTLPKGWSDYWLWQFTDKGEVPGITPPTDLNKYDYEEDDLKVEWSGRADDLEPIPPEEMVVRVIAPEGVRIVVEQETK